MDYKELVERLRTESLYKDKATLEIMGLCMDAAADITDLLAENQATRNAANGFKVYAETAERDLDAAVKDLNTLRKQTGYKCFACYYNDHYERNTCAGCDYNNGNNWEWRGIKGEES